MGILADSDGTPLSIPNDLAEELKKRAEDKGFSSLSNYVVYILRQVISRIDQEQKKDEAASEEDEEKIKDRLRKMGYLE